MKPEEAFKASFEEIRNEIARRQGALVLLQMDRMQEAWTQFDNYVDPREAYFDDPSGETWQSLQGTDPDQLSSGFETEELLQEARRRCRVLANENGYAISGHENRNNYVVGKGHQYTVTSRDPKKPSKLVDKVQDVLDDFVKRNDWYTRQGEHSQRMDRDGEVFLRLYRNGDGLTVRVVEPGQIFQVGGNESDTFGVRTDPKDVETVKGYWVDEDFVPADRIQHRKANVDKNVKRGMPTFWPIRNNLERAFKLLRNMSTVTTIQASIAAIRKINNVSRDAFSAYMGNLEVSSSTSWDGKKESEEDWSRPGRIITNRGNEEYEFPIVGVNASEMVGVLDAELRCCAARLVMPEWMFAANARNNNMASSIVAGSPAYRNFEKMQNEMIEDDEKILWLEVELACESGRIPASIEQVLQEVEIETTAPDIENLDPEARTKKNQTLKQEGVLSVRTWSEKEGLDYDTEQQNNVKHSEEYGDMDEEGIPDEDDVEDVEDEGDEE